MDRSLVDAKAQANAVDLDDVQGLLRFGYGKLTEACYLLLRIRDAMAAAAWLASSVPQVSTAATSTEKPSTAMQLAFTFAGLRALGLEERILSGFSPEFIHGMAGEVSRSRRLGDMDANAPQTW